MPTRRLMRRFMRRLMRQIALAVSGLSLTLAAQAAPTWLHGDTHVHDDHSSDGSLLRQTLGQGAPGNLSVADQIDAATLAGLDFLPLTDHRTYDQHYDPLWRSNRVLLVPGEEANGSPHATVLGAVDTIVQGAMPPGRSDPYLVQLSIWDAHAQDADWNTAHPDDGETNDDGTPNGRASAVGIDNIETWNIASDPEAEIAYAEDRWNHGFRTGITGASDDHFKEVWAIAGPGMPNTDVLAPNQTVLGVIAALRAGHTRLHAQEPVLPVALTATLEADFDGDGRYEALGGDEVIVPAGTPGHLRITVDNGAGSVVQLYKSPGHSAGVWKRFVPRPLARGEQWLVDVTARAEPAWYRVEVRGPGMPESLNPSQKLLGELRAQTAPIFISTAPVEAQPELPPPADGGGDDGATAVIGSRGEWNGFPDLAESGGLAHLVAEAHHDGRSQLRYARRDADGRWSAPVDLVPQSTQARFPRIAARGADVWVVWQDERGWQRPHRSTIWLRHSADGGLHWQLAQCLRTTDSRAEHPAIALAADGTPLVAWQEIPADGPFDVMAQRVGVDAAPLNLSNAGKTIRVAGPLDTRSSRMPASVWPAVAAADDGTLVVVWQDDRDDPDPLWTGSLGNGDGTNPDDWQLMSTTLAPGAGRWSTPVDIGAHDRADRHPALATAADGTLVLAWDSRVLQSSGANLSVRSAVSHDGGLSWSAPAAVDEDRDTMSQWPRLGRDSAGQVRIAWYDSRSADWRWRVVSSVLGDGEVWLPATLIDSRCNNSWPAVAGDDIAWASTRAAQRLQRDRTQQIVVRRAP